MDERPGYTCRECIDTHVGKSMLDQVQLGEAIFSNVPVLVAQKGDLHISLIGMSFLRRFEGFSANGESFLIAY